MSRTDLKTPPANPHKHDHGLAQVDAALVLKAPRVHTHPDITARLDAIEEAAAVTKALLLAAIGSGSFHPPAPEPAVITDLPNWDLVFYDEFSDRTVAQGHFMDGATDLGSSLGWRTADGRYRVAREEWADTSGHGTRGDGDIVEIANGLMRQHFYADADGWGHSCILTPYPTGGSTKGGIVGLRYLTSFAKVTQGQVFGGDVQNIPTVAMHCNMQFETSLDGQIPVANTGGVIEIERVAIWHWIG